MSLVLLALAVIPLVALTVTGWQAILHARRSHDDHPIVVVGCLWLIAFATVWARVAFPEPVVPAQRLIISSALLVAAIYLLLRYSRMHER